jgi:hypothetical protein
MFLESGTNKQLLYKNYTRRKIKPVGFIINQIINIIQVKIKTRRVY